MADGFNIQELKTGICIKDMNRKVLSQNDFCHKFCGDKIGQNCSTGCMLFFANSEKQVPASDITHIGYTFVQNLESADLPSGSTPKSTCDAVILNDGQTLTTILFPKDEFVKKMKSLLIDVHFTETEKSIVHLVLIGQSNREIAKRLFICTQTLKTHLNNINKKLPRPLTINQLRQQSRLIVKTTTW